MGMERPLRVFIGLAIMAATVTAVGSIGGWSRSEPPADHAAKPAHKPEPKQEAKPETKPGAHKPEARPASKPEPLRIEPVWTDPNRAAQPARAERAKPAPARIDQGSPAPTRGNEPGDHADHAEPAPHHEPAADQLTADEALTQLREGNERWVSASPQAPNTSESRRRAVAEQGQVPFATILTCADSRIPVERVFDRGVGDLFVLRVAGNVAGPHEAGTIEYGAEHLHVPVLVVMGHTSCGAVSAAASGAEAPGNVGSLVAAITPAVERARSLNPSLEGPDLAAAAVRENVWQSVFDLIRSSDACRERIASGSLRVVGAVYDIATGRVEWLGEHPWQREIIAAMESRDSHRRADAPTDHAD